LAFILANLGAIWKYINVKKTTFTKTVPGDVVAHLKPQKLTVVSDL